jgi:hypothetical protein
MPAPEDPFLADAERACVRLALGDVSTLAKLLEETSPNVSAIVSAIRSAGVANRVMAWLTERAAKGHLGAAALLLETPGVDEAALRAARSAAAPALRRVGELRARYEDGEITQGEFDGALADIVRLADALGADGASLLEALQSLNR